MTRRCWVFKFSRGGICACQVLLSVLAVSVPARSSSGNVISPSYWDYRRLFDSNITVKGMNPAFVGPYLFKAVEENHMYKVPHMHTHEQIRARHRRIESDLEREEALHEKYAPLQKY